MSDVLSTQHQPALRVGGRRLSVSTRPKPHTVSGASAPANARSTDDADYPRPAATQGEGEEQAHDAHPPPHNEEEPPKKEKKRGHGGHDQNRLKEGMHHKLDATTPAKDHLASKNGFGAAGRIGQPLGKSLAV